MRCVSCSLEAALCISQFAAQDASGQNKPEVETRLRPELLLNPIIISRSLSERTKIESSINSVRISISFKKIDERQQYILRKITTFLCHRAELFEILRRKPIQGYDISFLITDSHLVRMRKHNLIDFIVNMKNDIDAVGAEISFYLSVRAYRTTRYFLSEFMFPNDSKPPLSSSPCTSSTSTSTSCTSSEGTVASKNEDKEYKENYNNQKGSREGDSE